MYKPIQTLIFLISGILLTACSSEKSFQKNPIDDIIKDLNSVQEFSIVLYDMEEKGSWSKDYFHQYQIITTKNPEADTPEVEEKKTEFLQVSKDYFQRNAENMGMEIVSKQDGKVNKTASPAGYSNYVGDKRYGQWQSRSDGTSFWAFYGRYAFMSSMFNMMTYPVYRSYYNDWGGYNRRGQAYYGPTSGGRSYYGTYGKYNSSRSTRYTSSNSFRNRVNNRTSRSSRSGSRYNSRRSSRSRSGGFGK